MEERKKDATAGSIKLKGALTLCHDTKYAIITINIKKMDLKILRFQF